MFKRIFKYSKSHSFFLFGARGTGKSTVLHHVFDSLNDVLFLDLLDPAIEKNLAAHPERLLETITSPESLRVL